MRARTALVFVACLALLLPAGGRAADGYQHFDAAIYARAYEVREMADLEWLRSRFEVMEKHLKVSKMYLETHRDEILVDSETLEKAKAFFADRGIATAGGITLTINERNRFETFCYSDPEHRAWVQEVVEHTARHFDEVILDDFFFTSCKSEVEIEARGDRSWTEYRLALLDEVARTVVVGPARKVNPDVKVVIKYPNWYEHFHGLGFNLETQPQLFDAVYTGTETRDATRSAQHLQPYHGYQIWRYFENLRPGHNAGGWVDTGGMRYLDRYAEQLWLTLFAKSPEITLFDFRQMQIPLQERHRAPWQGQGTSLEFEEVVGPYKKDDGFFAPELTVARLAGWSLEKVDPIIGQLGEPVGVKSYKPFHSTGEDFLHNFMGMVGIPIDLRPEFPSEAPLVLLTEAAKRDNPADLYALPDGALNMIRRIATQGLDLRMDGPAEVSLFLYDNDTLIVESFRDETAEVSIVASGEVTGLRDLETGEVLTGEKVPEGQGWFRSPDAGKTVVMVPVKPHSYRALARE